MPIEKFDGAADRVVGMMPELVDKVSSLFKKDKKKKEPVDVNNEAADSDEDIF